MDHIKSKLELAISDVNAVNKELNKMTSAATSADKVIMDSHKEIKMLKEENLSFSHALSQLAPESDEDIFEEGDETKPESKGR